MADPSKRGAQDISNTSAVPPMRAQDHSLAGMSVAPGEIEMGAPPLRRRSAHKGGPPRWFAPAMAVLVPAFMATAAVTFIEPGAQAHGAMAGARVPRAIDHQAQKQMLPRGLSFELDGSDPSPRAARLDAAAATLQVNGASVSTQFASAFSDAPLAQAAQADQSAPVMMAASSPVSPMAASAPAPAPVSIKLVPKKNGLDTLMAATKVAPPPPVLSQMAQSAAKREASFLEVGRKIRTVCRVEAQAAPTSVQVSAKVTVGPTGSASAVGMSGNSDAVSRCVERVLRAYTFPEEAAGTTVDLPFSWRKQ